MGLYEELRRDDKLEPIVEDLKRFKYVMDDEDRIVKSDRIGHIYDSPYIWSGKDPSRICYVWHEIYFKKYGFVSRNCFNCWKIVYRCNHIDELFKVHALQVSQHKKDPVRFNSKCGAELRPYCSWKSRYAAYWYCSMAGRDGLLEARKLAKEVEDGLRELVNPEAKVILKRGCTEMEEKHGPSELWTYPEEFHGYEDELDEFIEMPPKDTNHQSKEMKTRILKRWLDHAFMTGDPTVKDFCDNYPESFGITPTTDYLRNEPKIISGSLERGKINERDKNRGKQEEEEKQSGICVI